MRCPGALDDDVTVGRTTPWTFMESILDRKVRIGIDLALGSPSVLPKEGTPDRFLAPDLHGKGATSVLARTIGGAVVCKGGASSMSERQGCQKLGRTKLPR